MINILQTRDVSNVEASYLFSFRGGGDKGLHTMSVNALIRMLEGAVSTAKKQQQPGLLARQRVVTH